jgi:hypothetical protein
LQLRCHTDEINNQIVTPGMLVIAFKYENNKGIDNGINHRYNGNLSLDSARCVALFSNSRYMRKKDLVSQMIL